MPRARKTQAPRAPGDQAYGEKGKQIEAQKALPLPDNTGPPQGPVGAAPAQAQPPVSGIDQALMAAQSEAGRAGPMAMGAASQRPSEGVMTPSTMLETPEVEQARLLNDVMVHSGSVGFKHLANRLMMRKAMNGPVPNSQRFSPTRRRTF